MVLNEPRSTLDVAGAPGDSFLEARSFASITGKPGSSGPWFDCPSKKRSSPPSGNSTSMLILIAEAPGEVTETEETMDPSPISSQSSCGARSPWNSSEMARCTPI